MLKLALVRVNDENPEEMEILLDHDLEDKLLEELALRYRWLFRKRALLYLQDAMRAAEVSVKRRSHDL